MYTLYTYTVYLVKQLIKTTTVISLLRYLSVTLTKLLLTDDEKDSTDQHSSRQHMFRANILRWFAHGAKLVSQWVSPEVGEKQSTEKEGKGTVSSTPGSLHLSTANGLDIELQDHHAEDDHPKRQDDR